MVIASSDGLSDGDNNARCKQGGGQVHVHVFKINFSNKHVHLKLPQKGGLAESKAIAPIDQRQYTRVTSATESVVHALASTVITPMLQPSRQLGCHPWSTLTDRGLLLLLLYFKQSSPKYL